MMVISPAGFDLKKRVNIIFCFYIQIRSILPNIIKHVSEKRITPVR